MTRYAYDPERQLLLATWRDGGTGGDRCLVVAETTGATPSAVRMLAGLLTDLSISMWRTYTHPVQSGEGAADELNTEAWRRAQDLSRLDGVLESVRRPNLPERGMVRTEYSWIGENAHRVGRELHGIGDPSLLDSVLTDLGEEIAAVHAAHEGQPHPRARQVVEHSSPHPPASMVVAAEEAMRDDSFGTSDQLHDLDPSAASVALLRWLRAAVGVAADATGVQPNKVIRDADDIEPMPVRTINAVLSMLRYNSPQQVVTDLLYEAQMVAEGQVGHLDTLADSLRDMRRKSQREGFDMSAVTLKLCLLDPRRPAADLFEDLVQGIHGCWLLYYDHHRGLSDDELPDADYLDLTGDVPDPEFDDTHTEKLMRKFDMELRHALSLDPNAT